MFTTLMAALGILIGSDTPYINSFSFVPRGGGGSLAYDGQSDGVSAGWLTRHPERTEIIYSTNTVDADGTGELWSYQVQPNGTVEHIASVASSGLIPAHMAIIRNGTEAMVANYQDGSVQAYKLSDDRAHFGASTGLIKFNGSGPNPDRQTEAHCHQIVEYGNEVFVPDLGSDKIWRLGKSGDQWVSKGFISQPSGSGPRHVVPYNGKLYVTHELSNTVTEQIIPPLYSAYIPGLISSISIVPPTAPNGSEYGAAELLLSPETDPVRYLYASIRNVSTDPDQLDPLGDTISIFSIEPKLTLIRHVYTGLQQVRDIAIGGDKGQYLVAGGNASGGIVVYERVGDDLKVLATYDGEGSGDVVALLWI